MQADRARPRIPERSLAPSRRSARGQVRRRGLRPSASVSTHRSARRGRSDHARRRARRASARRRRRTARPRDRRRDDRGRAPGLSAGATAGTVMTTSIRGRLRAGLSRQEAGPKPVEEEVSSPAVGVTVPESTWRHRRGDCSTSRASTLSFPLFSWLVVVFVVVHVIVFVGVAVLVLVLDDRSRPSARHARDPRALTLSVLWSILFQDFPWRRWQALELVSCRCLSRKRHSGTATGWRRRCCARRRGRCASPSPRTAPSSSPSGARRA